MRTILQPLISIQFFVFLMLQHSVWAQNNKYKVMKATVNSLVSNLKKCDMAEISKMFDTVFNQKNQPKNRDFMETLRGDCFFFKNVVAKYGIPPTSKMTFSKDSFSAANIASLPLIEKSDSELNIETSSLVVFFYPDQFFKYHSSQFLNFLIVTKPLRLKKPLEIEQIKQE